MQGNTWEEVYNNLLQVIKSSGINSEIGGFGCSSGWNSPTPGCSYSYSTHVGYNPAADDDEYED